MTLKNNRTPLLSCLQLCASFHNHQWILSGFFYSPEALNLDQNRCFLSSVTFKFGRSLWITIGHLCYAILSFVHHFKAIGEFKLKLRSGNAQLGSKSVTFFRVTLKLDGWPWKTIGHIFYVGWSFVHYFIATIEFKLELQSGNAQFGSKSMYFFVPRDLEIWQMTL